VSKAAVERLSAKLRSSEVLEADAAVVVLLRVVNDDVEVLLVTRAKKATDPWSGQTALPGGKLDREDRNMKQTVVRETMEETSINLLDGCRFLGAMELLNPTNKPEMTIVPFVVLLDRKQLIVLNEELTEHFWMPLKKLDASRGAAKFGGKEVAAFRVEGCVIWGLTYRILDRLLSLF
jgi:8-oxo-dGTP pyrophosphatase MutT (NUDIX family)